MKERPDTSPWLRLLGTAIFSLAFASPLALAQGADDNVDEGLDSDDDVREEIVVTGSRLRRDTFSSVAPLQVITGEVSRNLGAIDPGTIMQDSTASAGVQFDTTFGGFVLDNGPGASTADLRGLGSARTLLLLNGR